MKRMRVGIDGHMVGGQETGNETYIKGLVDGLAELKPELDALVFHVDGAWASARPPLTFQRLVTGSPYFRLVVDLPARSVAQRLDVLHMTYAAPVWSAAPIVLTVHDICYATN
ncbi:MAG: glycosyltransferase family 4 protein, partial [Chloroflexi bacterium]